MQVRRTPRALPLLVFLVAVLLFGLGCSSGEPVLTATQQASPKSAAHEEEVGHELYLALVALGVGDVADARHHVLHFQESASPGELELVAEILDMLKRNELHDAEHRIQELRGEEEHDDRVRHATRWGLATAVTPHDGEMRIQVNRLVRRLAVA